MFKHTAALMGHTQNAKVQNPTNAKDRQKFMDQLAGDIQAIQDMSRSPGWAIFMQEVEVERVGAMEQLQTAQGDQLAKLTGVLLTCEAYRNWPAQRVNELQEILTEYANPGVKRP